MCKTTNGKYSGTVDPEIYGMIDGNAYHNSKATWPASMAYCVVENVGKEYIRKNIRTMFVEKIDLNIHESTTMAIGDTLVKANTKMYNEKMQKYVDGNTGKEDLPSLIITPTMDMEFAHSSGYYHEATGVKQPYPLKVNQHWNGKGGQVEEIEAAVVAHPLRLFPLFSYDPRRYRRDEAGGYMSSGYDISAISEQWDYPFAHIVGHGSPTPARVWLGFCMNPQLGFRPFDENCKHLPAFYEKCADEDIPILAHCSPDGFIAYDADSYNNFDVKVYFDRIKNGKAHCSNEYCGREIVVSNNIDADHFYRNYGHPKNWVPVLEHRKDLHLCLAHFGGNSEWSRNSMNWWAKINIQNAKDASLPSTREWIRCIIKLTKYYENVYTDISGLDIGDAIIRSKLQGMLCAICENDDFHHLKYKLIFGSNRYFSYTNNKYKDYSDYCQSFKSLFYNLGDSGKELWERVSLLNPWNFYGLSSEKFKAIHGVLPQLAKELKEELSGILTIDYSQNWADAMLKGCGKISQSIPPFFKYNPPEQKGGDDDLDPMVGNASCGRASKGEIPCAIKEVAEDTVYEWNVLSRDYEDSETIPPFKYNPVKQERNDEDLKPSSCGLAYRGEVVCTVLNGVYGPIYAGNLCLKDYGNNHWEKLITERKILTLKEKGIIIGVSENEGKFDTIQSYDNQIVSVGIMQKTINEKGTGQFSNQIGKFKEKHPDNFKALFERCGWTVEKDIDGNWKAYYNNKTGNELKKIIRDGFTKKTFNSIVPCTPIEPLINATKDPIFQAIEIEDFLDELKTVLIKHPKCEHNITRNTYTLEKYLKSSIGIALALDQQVNKPAYVARDFGRALDNFFGDNDDVSRNPSDWGEQHREYEKKIIDCYATLRDVTNSKKRYNNLTSYFKHLKDDE